MRVIEEIPHHTFKITVFHWNARYLVKIELDKYEQTYKINEGDVTGVSDVKKMLTDEFLESCMHRFLAMRTDFTNAVKNIEYEV